MRFKYGRLLKKDLFGMTMIGVGHSRLVFLSPDCRTNFNSFALRFLAALAQTKDRRMFNYTFGVSRLKRKLIIQRVSFLAGSIESPLTLFFRGQIFESINGSFSLTRQSRQL